MQCAMSDKYFKCDGSRWGPMLVIATVPMAMSAVLRECGAYKARAVNRRIWQTNPSVAMVTSAVLRECPLNILFAVKRRTTKLMHREFERRVNDEDICISSGRQAMMGRKCCRYTVKRGNFDVYAKRSNVLHQDLQYLYDKHETANVWPELLVCMHLFNALDLQFPRQWHDSKSLELGRESGIMCVFKE